MRDDAAAVLPVVLGLGWLKDGLFRYISTAVFRESAAQVTLPRNPPARSKEWQTDRAMGPHNADDRLSSRRVLANDALARLDRS